MKEHLTSSWISPSSAKCPLATFSIPHHWTVHLLIVSMLPVVGAIPSSNGISTDNIFRKDISTSTSAPSSTTLSASSTSSPGSHASSNTQLVLLISGEFRISVCRCCSKEQTWRPFKRDAGKTELHCNEHDVKGLFADFTQSLLQYCCHSCDHPLPLEVVAETERSLIFKDPREG